MPMSEASSPIHWSATEIAKRIAQRDVSSSEVTQAFVKRIQEVNPRLNAVVVPRFEEALKEALDIVGDRDLGLLFGFQTFPTPVEDCYAALVWAHDHADELGIDPTRIAVGGESAGANLAAVLCLVSRDRGGPALCHQWLDIPATDLTMTQPSFTEVPDGYLLDGAAMREFRRYYIGDRPLERDPYVSPLFAPDHSGLPPAWILSAEYDKLRDDGKAYAAALEAAGVPVQYQVLPGHVHSSVVMTRLFPSAKAYETEAIAALAKAFANA